MATETVTQTTRAAPFIEAAGKTFLDDLQKAIGGFKTADLSQVYGPQFTAGLGALTQDAISKAGGLGSFQPFLQTAATEAGKLGQLTGPSAYQQFMSPYQRDVIDTTLAEFDVQAAKGIPGIAAQAVSRGVLGGGREGVQRAEYQATSDRNRAALQAQLLGQGFTQANQLANQAFANQQNILASQLGLARAAPQLAGQEITGLTTLGGLQQAQTQAGLTAQQQLAQRQLEQPLSAAQQYGSGVTSLIAGYPGQRVQDQVVVPSTAQTALGAGATLAGIYRAFS